MIIDHIASLCHCQTRRNQPWSSLDEGEMHNDLAKSQIINFSMNIVLMILNDCCRYN